MGSKITKSEREWREVLTPLQFNVTQGQDTERAFTGEYWNHEENGIYRCVCCGEPLFDSTSKYDSGTGWPSFFEPAASDSVETEQDRALGTVRTEVHCNICDAHLGHLFTDGPAPTGLRYCINSASLRFDKKE